MSDKAAYNSVLPDLLSIVASPFTAFGSMLVIQLARFTPSIMSRVAKPRRGVSLTTISGALASDTTNASPFMPPVRTMGRPATSTRRHPPARAFDPASDLSGLAAEQWEVIDEEMRRPLLLSIDTRYKQYLENFYETANLCVRRHDACVRNHRMWRYVAIIGTGLLACLNFMAAKHSIEGAGGYNVLPILASLGALALAVLANLETFANSAERAQAYRESRELYLDAAEEYDRAWSVAVVALGDTAQAYANAVALDRRIVDADRELRRSFKELTKHGK